MEGHLHAERGSVETSLFKGDEIGEDDGSQALNGAASETLYGPPCNHHGHGARATTNAASEEKETDT